MRFIVLLSTLLVAFSFQLSAQNEIYGKWKTIDDETEEIKSVVEIYEKDGKAWGKVIQLFRGPDEDQNPVCEECDEDDPRYKTPVKGMNVIRNMEFNIKKGEWTEGDILDPENGKVYTCKLWLDEETGNLKVRGYIAFLYRTQTWLPYSED